ncbi:MAG: LysR family transcriptional regulator, partial [Paeniglutamicibacter terrestris]
MNLDSHPRLTLRQLWHFVVAAEAGTMAEAARRLHMAPSAISMSIAELER